ncbi:hypothetical protein NK718_05390 [Alsobacter sp. SYSU M60028]|uniref:Aminoglycoside phosphotransferase domain-containing protein n=1 Tax=Alsobacter ponti TaxID=2962936 RepID=A0ABT1LAE7_9HYPH|nr:hypothetical protein [Alsobacter ponti]MCP8937941.1 hypothetical protein [Alsobacter ponti]
MASCAAWVAETGGASGSEADGALAASVALLSRPETYGLPADTPVAVRETRTSFVFLTPTEAYKLKKPIRDALMDFTTLAARRRNAEEETRLNARLAATVYLGVVPLARAADGGLALGGPGEPVDWLVRMRRLFDDGFLDRALAERRVDRRSIEAAAERLAGFYARQTLVAAAPAEHVAAARRQILAARAILLHPRFGLSRRRVTRLCGSLLHVARDGGPLARRLALRPPVEGHGDLRPEHVWLDGAPLAIDCLEFSRPLRLVDPFDELGFLGLECERLGAPWVGPILLDAATRALDDRPTPDILRHYRSFRAVLRAALALRHYLEPPRREPKRWMAQAKAYLRLAAADPPRG